MARVNAPLLAFNRGEVSKLALSRVDLTKLQLAAQCQLNFEPKVVGSMGLRPGLPFIGEVYNDQPCGLYGFVYAKADTSLLEFTDGRMRVWIDDVLLTRPAVGTAVLDPNFAGTGGHWTTANTSSGASATFSGGLGLLAAAGRGSLAQFQQVLTIAPADQNVEHGLRLTVAVGPVTLRVGSSAGLDDLVEQTVIDTGTHSIPFTPAGGSAIIQIETRDPRRKSLSAVTIDAAGALTLPTPWTASDLGNIRAESSGDIIYVAAYGIQQRKIERRGTRPGARGWSVVTYQSDNGPFLAAPSATNLQLSSSVYEGNGILSASRPLFTSGHVGALFQLFTTGQQNQTTLASGVTFSEPVRVSGVNTDRRFAWKASGTWAGVLTLQRSLEGPDAGFVSLTPVATANGTYDQDDSNVAGVANVASLNNVVAWYRVGFGSALDYTSGAAVVEFTNHSTGYNAASTGGRFGICRVLSVVDSTNANIEVLAPFSSLVPTEAWQEGQWSSYQGWPTAVAFQEGRLTWTGRDRMWFGQSENYTGYAVQDTNGNSLGDDAAILEVFGQGPVDVVSWMLPLTRPLFGREMSIAAARSSSFDEPITPTNFSVKDCATQGAARLPAVKIDKRGVFVQQSGRRVYQLAFDAQAMDYTARDLTRLNIDIGKPHFTDIAVARQPDTAIYLPRTEGQCAVLLFDPDDDVEAWYRFQTLGIIENVRVLPSATGIEDDVYFVVRRTVNGVTRRFIEKLARRDDCVGGTINQLFDCSVTYSGSAATTITAAHLPNTSIGIWGDGQFLGTATTNGSGVATLPEGKSASNIVAGLLGSVETQTAATPTGAFIGLSAFEGLPAEVFADQQPSQRMIHVGTLTVSGGRLTLPRGQLASKIVAVFGFVAPFMSAKLAYAAQAGSPVSQKKKIDHVGLVLADTHQAGIQVGQRFDALDGLPAYESSALVPDGTIWSEYDEPAMELPGEWDTDARLCLLAQAPYPCNVTAAIVSIATNES